MHTGKYQFLSIVAVFTSGFFFQDFVSGISAVDDVYRYNNSGLLQCTINIDCDNYYDRKILFPGEKVPDNKTLLEYQRELKLERRK